jgi:hypothetical protein
MDGISNVPDLTAGTVAGEKLRQSIRDFLAEESEGGLASFACSRGSWRPWDETMWTW